MRDRKLAIETATAVQQRLSTDNATAESCQSFALALETVLHNWGHNVERLNALSIALYETARLTRIEDESKFTELPLKASESMNALKQQVISDLAPAIEAQRSVLNQLAEPARSAESIAQSLLQQMEQLQARVSGLNDVSLAKPDSQRS